jgi:hypothetical protein
MKRKNQEILESTSPKKPKTVKLLQTSYLHDLRKKRALFPAYLQKWNDSDFQKRIWVQLNAISVVHVSAFNFDANFFDHHGPYLKLHLPAGTCLDRQSNAVIPMFLYMQAEGDNVQLHSDSIDGKYTMYIAMTAECLVIPTVLPLLKDVLQCDVFVHQLICEFYA